MSSSSLGTPKVNCCIGERSHQLKLTIHRAGGDIVRYLQLQWPGFDPACAAFPSECLWCFYREVGGNFEDGFAAIEPFNVVNLSGRIIIDEYCVVCFDFEGGRLQKQFFGKVPCCFHIHGTWDVPYSYLYLLGGCIGETLTPADIDLDCV